MLHKFQQYIESEELFNKNDKILLAISGGIDSMVMMDLFKKVNLNFTVAHCNFKLRGQESDDDERFVIETCNKLSIQVFSKSFDTNGYSKEKKVSIQMAARELRYNWFEELAEKEGYKYIATAHHKDDEIETFLINLTRGTGIAGLHGILPKKGKLIRPLLFANRAEIKNYAINYNIAFREDSSNSSVKYSRNKIRHEIIPKFEEINENFTGILSANILRIKETEQIYKDKISELKRELVTQNDNQIRIIIEGLKTLKSNKTIIFEIISEFGFNYSQASDIIEAFDHSGKQFYSQNHRLTIDRDYLILEHLEENNQGNNSIAIHEKEKEISSPINLLFYSFPYEKQEIPRGYQIAWIDKSKLEFPLELRKWKQGDFFYPFGMKGKKLLSDYFIDEKFSIPDKENTWLLCSNNKIVWIIGHRIDNRFAISNKTKAVFEITLKNA